ncbi:transposase [Acidomonas methanolica]|nr:hypothetical protein EDC31_1462 [Acidomonas methanolica]GBQ52294.1 transposase [Acidomonas methanolica]
MKQAGFFDVDERLARLSGVGDQLEAFSWTVDFEVFRPDLDRALAYADGSKGGRPPFDPMKWPLEMGPQVKLDISGSVV